MKDLVETLFAHCDHDNNGFITASELKTVISDFGMNITFEDTQALIQQADHDGSGCLDKHEFLKMLERYANLN